MRRGNEAHGVLRTGRLQTSHSRSIFPSDLPLVGVLLPVSYCVPFSIVSSSLGEGRVDEGPAADCDPLDVPGACTEGRSGSNNWTHILNLNIPSRHLRTCRD